MSRQNRQTASFPLPSPLPERPRILIVRLSALGDVIHGVPVLCALRRKFPEAHLAWVCEGRPGELIADHADLDELIRVPRGWLKSPQEVWKLGQRLRAERFDVAVDLQSLTKSAVAARLSAARRRIGVAGRDGRELSRWINNELVALRARHVIEHYLGLLKPLGIENAAVEFRLPHFEAAAESVQRQLHKLGMESDRFAILNAGAGWASKIWPAERYGEVAQHLLKRQQLFSLVLWAGEEERNRAQQIVEASAGTAQMAPETDLFELTEVCRRAAIFLGSDTGPLHLSVAVGTPTISMHGTTRAAWSGAYGVQNRRLQAYYDGGTARHRRGTSNTAMRAISVETVCQSIDELLIAHHSSARLAA